MNHRTPTLAIILAGVFGIVVSGLASAAPGTNYPTIPPVAPASTGPSENYTPKVDIHDVSTSKDRDGAESPMGRIEAQKTIIGGDVTPELRASLLQEAARIRAKQVATVGGTWSPQGPTNITRFQNGINRAKDNSGRLRTILPDPRRADTVYLLTSGGGLWKTTNFSAAQPTWVPKTDLLYATAGGSAAFGRTPDVIYLGSGDPFDLGIGGVMYKSVDGGDTWSTPITLPGAGAILDIKVDTSAGSTTANDVVLVGTNAGLYRSTDGGASFTYVSIDAGLESYWSSVLAPALGTVGGQEDWSLVKSSAGWLVARSYWLVCSNCNEYNVAYVSTDQGATWNYIPDAGPIGGNFDAGRTTLTAAGPGNGTVYALAANNDGSDQLDIFRSTDGGMNFAALGTDSAVPTNPTLFNPNMDLLHGQAWYNQMVLADPSDATGQTVYAGGNLSSAVSRDGGATWTLLTDWLGGLSTYQAGLGAQYTMPYAHADFHAAAVSMAGKSPRILFGNDGGIFYSNDGGKSFSDNANVGLQTALIYSLAVGPVHPNNTLLGLQDNGTLFRVNGGTYTGSIGGDGFGTAWSQANDDISMGSLYYLDIRRWTSNPPNNQAKYDVLLNTSNLAGGAPDYPWYYDSYFNTPIATPTPTADPSGHTFFTNTAHYLLKTSDGGSSWSAVWTSPSAARVIRSASHTIGLAPDNLNHIGLAGNSGTVIYTHNGGTNWSIVNVTTSVPSWPGFNTTVGFATNHDVMYVGNAYVGGGAHVARSADGGATWVNATGDLPQVPVTKVVVDPNDASGNTLYVANWIGVYRSTNAGANWARVGTGLPLARISDLYFEPHGKFLRIASYGRGVWQLALPL